ncbi:anti-sigma factor [Modestobacter sp. NPDC049651]|uniref:anti-sigma factor n=1 Tax=unclassified Modestobacter TaxID=2643866 RepID=UPI00340EB058
MQHCSPEQLALAALREPLPPDDTVHLGACAECQREVASLRRGVDALAVPEFAVPGAAVAPPPRVWDAIAAATGVTATPAGHPVGVAQPVEPPPAPVVPMQRARPSRRWLAVAAAVVVGGVVGAGAVALSRDGGSPARTGTVVASAGLDPLDDEDASGKAAVHDHDGRRSLQVDLRAPRLDDGYYEVWLLQPDAVRMVPVGVVRSGDTVLPLPDDIDLAAYPVVDVSIEPMDGDPTHSGVSVARGSLSR